MKIDLREIALFCVCILFLSVIACARPNTKICRRKNGKFPKPGSACKGYYECKQYVPEEMTCPDGEHFNANKEMCDWEDLYPCLEKKKDKECLRENGLFLKPGTKCQKFYRCCNGKAKVENCPGGTLFDPFKENCEWTEIYTCVESFSTTEKLPSTAAIFGTSTSPGEQKKKSSTDPSILKSSTQMLTTTIQITNSTHDPDLERTISKVLDISTKSITQPTPTDLQSTTFQIKTRKMSTAQPTTEGLTSLEQRETSTVVQSTTAEEIITSQSTTTEIPTEASTPQPTTNEIPASQSTAELSTSESDTTENPTFQSTTDLSTLQPTTIEIPTSQSTTEISSTQPTTTEFSTAEISLKTTTETSTFHPTSREISTISQTSSPQISFTHSTGHTILKESKEGKITEPTNFETPMEITLSQSTPEVTTSVELNLMCPEPNGYFPHPTDKHKFVGCVNDVPNILTCPSDLVYKHRLRRCDYE